MDRESQTRPYDETYPQGLPEPDWPALASGATLPPLRTQDVRVFDSHEKNRIVDAFRKRPLTKSEENLVRALLEKPGSTPAELTSAMGWSGVTAWHLQFGKLCRRRQNDLGQAPPAPNRKTADGKVAEFLSGLLVEWNDNAGSYTMRSAAVEAFADLGLSTVPK
jgi:hypothetical protein